MTATLQRPAIERPTAVRRSPGAVVVGSRVPAAVLAGGSAVIALTHLWGRWLQAHGHHMKVNAPPLTGNVVPRAGAWGLPALALAAGAVGAADLVAHGLRWRRLLWVSFAAALAWSASLALWDGFAGFTRSPASPMDHLAALPLVDGISGLIDTLLTDPSTLPPHVRSHPPGMVVALLGLDVIGLATPAWVALLEHVIGAASVPAVLLAAREVSGERMARSAAPFVVFSTIAITWSSGDAVVLGVGAWAVASLLLATGRERRRSDLLALGGGTLAAAAAFLSYGIVPLALVPASVAWHRRRLRPLAVAAIPVVAAVTLAGLGGFWWFEGLAITRTEYAGGVASARPYGYFLVANLAAMLIALGPAVWVGLSRLRDRGPWLLVAPALAAVVIADVSGFSKGEVERIWLPFLPWLVVGAGAAFAGRPAAARRGWLGLQLGWALLVQAIVVSPW